MTTVFFSSAIAITLIAFKQFLVLLDTNFQVFLKTEKRDRFKSIENQLQKILLSFLEGFFISNN